MPSSDQRKETKNEEHAVNELELLNRSMIDKATEIVTSNEPESDLWPQFRQANFDYKRRRSEILEARNPTTVVVGGYSRREQKRIKQAFLYCLDPEPKADTEKPDSFKHRIPEEDVNILWPLSSALQTLLQVSPAAKGVTIQNEQASTLRSILRDLLIRGELLYHHSSRAVFRISPETVVKIGKSDNTAEIHVLSHIHEHSQQMPEPLPLGMIRIGAWSYTFTSFIQGIPLDRIWGHLTPDKKCHVREQLNHLFTELRRLPGPSKEGYSGGGEPPICKGGHRHTKISSFLIANEAQFNRFLLNDSWLEPLGSSHHQHLLCT